MSRSFRLLLAVINLAVLVAATVWLVRNVDFTAVAGNLLTIPTSSLIGFLALNLALMLLYGIRLAWLLDAPWPKAIAIVLLGFGLNGLLPFRLGEVAKIGYARRFFGTPPEQLLLATGAEKIFDLSALLVIGISAVHSIYFDRIRGELFLAAAALGVAILLYALTLLITSRTGFPKVIQRSSWLLSATRMLQNQSRPLTLAVTLALTAAIWLITLLTILIFFRGSVPTFSLQDANVLSLSIALALGVPGAPAGLGLVEAGIVAYLRQIFDADVNQALALALVYRFCTSFPQVMAALAIVVWQSRPAQLFRASLVRDA